MPVGKKIAWHSIVRDKSMNYMAGENALQGVDAAINANTICAGQQRSHVQTKQGLFDLDANKVVAVINIEYPTNYKAHVAVWLE